MILRERSVALPSAGHIAVVAGIKLFTLLTMTRFTSSIWWRIFTTLTLFLTTLTGFWSHAQFPRLAFFRGVLAAVIGVLSLLAGGLGGFGNADGTGFTPTLFNDPSGVAVDGAGNVYVADRDNHTIRKITATGVVTTFRGDRREFGLRRWHRGRRQV